MTSPGEQQVCHPSPGKWRPFGIGCELVPSKLRIAANCYPGRNLVTSLMMLHTSHLGSKGVSHNVRGDPHSRWFHTGKPLCHHLPFSNLLNVIVCFCFLLFVLQSTGFILHFFVLHEFICEHHLGFTITDNTKS